MMLVCLDGVSLQEALPPTVGLWASQSFTCDSDVAYQAGGPSDFETVVCLVKLRDRVLNDKEFRNLQNG